MAVIVKTYPVFVEHTTATELGITEVEGRPENLDKREGVFVGWTEPVKTYGVWSDIPESAQTKILENANRQAIQDAKNVFRADVKTGQNKAKIRSLEAERESITLKMQDPSEIPNLVALAQRFGQITQEIAKLGSK